MSKLGMEEVEDVLDPPPDLDDTVELSIHEVLPKGYLSVSQLTLFLKCPHQWYLRYVQGLHMRTQFRMFQGIQIHKAVEMIMDTRLRTGKLPSKDDALDVFSTTFEEQKSLIEDWDDKDPSTVKDDGIAITEVHYKEVAPRATPVQVEASFLVQLQGSDNGAKVPVFGRTDSLQVAAFTENEYQELREAAVEQLNKQEEKGVKYPKPPKLSKPLRVHDLKVCTKKWTQSKLDNDLQMAIYSGALGIPDVQVDQLVKGQAKKLRPRYEIAQTTVTEGRFAHASKVASGVMNQIAVGVFPLTDPGDWWCSADWCSMWEHCRGKLEPCKPRKTSDPDPGDGG